MVAFLAENAAPTGPAGGCNFSDPLLWLTILGTVAIFYFMILRPQKVQQVKEREMRAALKKGDRVLMSSGIIGRISSKTAHEITIIIDENRQTTATFPLSTLVGPYQTPAEAETPAKPQ